MLVRKGSTLVEVLVAIFVMGIGLLAILALFPLGAYRMAEAIKASRCANIAESGDAIANMWKIRSNSILQPNPNGVDLYLNPSGIPGFAGPPTPISSSSSGPSYPILIDPTGYVSAFPSPSASWVAGNPNYGISRCNVSFVNAATAQVDALTWFSFQDELIFNSSATPDFSLVVSPYFERDIRYSWAFLCQRPVAGNTSMVNLTTLVFNRRPLSLGGNIGMPEYVYGGAGNNTYFDLTRNVVSIDFSATGFSPGTLPPVRPGEWIMDASLDPTNNIPHAYFYRVVSITQIGATTVELEVQTPFRGFPLGTTLTNVAPWTNAPFLNRLIVLEGLVEVFDRGPGPG